MSNEDNSLMDREVVQEVNEETGVLEEQERGEYDQVKLLKDAKQSTQMKPEFVPIRDFYENEILGVYSSGDFE
jgi:hypothetical protein